MTATKRLQRLVWVGIAVCITLILLASVALDTAKEKKRRAHEQCKQIAFAAHAYYWSPWSPGSAEDEALRYPSLHDLVQPRRGGPSYLQNGDADTIDPWGKPIQFQIQVDPDDRLISVFVSTTAPDGTPISQHGIGPNAAPKPAE